MGKIMTVSELVAARKAKENELLALKDKIKIVRKDVKELNKKIQENLNLFITSGEINKEISEDNFGFDFKIKEKLDEENMQNLLELVKSNG